MPSASATNVKVVEKQIAQPDNALGGDNSTPLRQAITVIEHKIRNLEKRKSKLESYKELQNAGKTLNDDQKTAVAKFNEVTQTLDFARDLCKQFIGIVAVTEKDAKKQAKREASLKNQAELARLREILLVQDALNQMGSENVREDFLNGRNGSAQLTESDLKLLDDLYPAVTPKHEAGNPTLFTNAVQTAAEHLLAVVDGKQKDVFGGTYCQIKEVLGKIHESGYFDQAPVVEGYVEGEAVEVEVVPEVVPPPQPEITHQIPIETLARESLPVQVEVLERIVPQEPMYHQQPPPPPQLVAQPPPQPPRPISEMLGTGSFFFLQDSEIDPQPEQQIPSQTFTNQNFVSGMHLPPPIPMPPQHFQQPPLANNLPPPNMQPPQPQPPPQQQQQPIPQQQPPQQLGLQKNGSLEDREQDNHKVNHNNVNKYQNRNNQQQQSYYQNNGYNKDSYNSKDYKDNYNRPRQNRNNNGNPRAQNRH